MADSRKQMDALSSSFESKDESVQKEAYKKYQALQKDSAEKLLALSKKDPKDTGTVDALVMVLFSGRGSDNAKQALETLKSDYLTSPQITGLCFYLEHDQQEGRQVLEKIVESNTNAEPKASALLALGRRVKSTNPDKAEKYFEEITTKYPNAKYEIFGRKMNLGEEAKNELFEIQHLGIGKQAPEITGEDIGGKKFTLSDYRGKVVLLDFWGDW
jgi:tetratricopeptide (TPR) repeat protein